MSRLPDLVRDSRLETTLRSKYTSHVYHEADPSSRQRTVERREYWKREKRIGRGGFGLVWLERCVKGKLGVEVRAVKQFPKPNKTKDYIRELEAIAKFSHPRYVHCFVQSMGWWEDESELYIAMEYLHLGDLGTLLYTTQQPLPEDDVQHITSQILEGLSLMHQNGFAHRDLKPQNILIHSKPPEAWWVKIADFGISKRAEDATATYSTVKGTPGFMPPESLDHSSDELSTAADIWALGEIAHMMLTSQPTFKNTRELFQFADGQKEFPQESLRDHNASTTAIQFISASMNANPDERLNAAQASKHEWMAKFAPQSPRPASISSSGDDEDSDSLESEPGEDGQREPTEASARWSTIQSNATNSEDLHVTLRPLTVHNKPSAEELDSLSVHRLNSSDDPHTVLSRDSSIVPKLVQEVNMLEQDKLGRRVISGITQPYILAICDELFAIGSSNTPNIVYIIDGETDLLKQKISIPDWDPKDKLSEVVFSPRKDLVGVQRIYPKSIIHIYDLITGSEITGLYTWATEFVFSEDGACFAFWEGTVISIFDLNRLSVGVQIANPDTGSVIRVLGLDSERLWIARGMESIKIYSIPDGIFLKEISLHNRPGFGPSLGHFSWKCQTYFFTRREEDLIVSYLVDLDCEKDKVLPTLPMEKRDTGKISPLHSAISYNVRLGAVKSGLNTIAIYTLRTTKVCEVFAVSFAVHAIAFMRDGSLLVLGVEEEDSQRNLLYTVFTHYKKYETDSANEDHKSARPTSEIPLSNGSHKTVTSSTYDILSKVKTPVNPRETVDVRNEKGSPWTQALPLLPQKTPPAERDIKAREQLNYELDLISSEAEVQKKHGPKVSNLSRYKEFCYHKWSRKVWSTDHIATMCAISAGGSTFAILDGDNKIRIINRRIASQYCTIDIRTEKPSEYDVKVTRLTLSDTGDRLGVEMNRFQWTNSQDGVLYETFQIWDVGSQKLHRTFEAAGKSAFAVPTASFTFSPDGRSFVAYKEGIRICLSPMDSSLPAPIFLPLPPYADQLPCTIAFWDNMRIICWLEQMSGTLFDLQDLKLVGKNVAGNIIARGQAQNSRFHVFSYNLSILAYLTLKTSQRPYESLDIFSMLEGTTWTSILIPEQLRSHLSDVTLRISYGASDYLAAMFDNNEIRVWDINEGVEVASFPSDPSIRRMWIGFTLGHRLLVGGSPGPGSLVSVVDDFEYFVDDMGLFIRKNSRTEKKFPSSKLTTD